MDLTVLAHGGGEVRVDVIVSCSLCVVIGRAEVYYLRGSDTPDDLLLTHDVE